MNIFDIYLDKIKKIILDQYKNGLLKVPKNLNSINVDIPPKQFDCDISTNVAMVLSKLNQKSPIDIANQLTELIKKDDININSISVAKPGFINIKFENTFWNLFLKDIVSQLSFGLILYLSEGNIAAYKGAIIEIVEATNVQIKYKIIRNFSSDL